MKEPLKKFEQFVNERAPLKVDKKYTHFAVHNETGKIVDGWDYKGTDPDDIKVFYKQDMKDNDRDLKEFKLLTAKHLISKGIDPYNWESWRKNEDKF